MLDIAYLAAIPSVVRFVRHTLHYQPSCAAQPVRKEHLEARITWLSARFLPLGTRNSKISVQ